MGLFDKIKSSFSSDQKEDLNKGLEKSSKSIFEKLSKAVAGKSEVDMDVLDEIEEALMSCDVSLDTTVKIIDRLEARVGRDKYVGIKELYQLLKEEISDMLDENNTVDEEDYVLPFTGRYPYVLLVVGVNGVGKTTTIGKLANKYKLKGNKVLLGAADTFRAAAIEQLEVWSKRVDIPIIKSEMGADPASIAFKATEEALNGGYDVVIIDTAGRLHNKTPLMNELSKIKRVVQKVIPNAPHDVMLVLDGSTGQNALEQAKHFTAATEVTALTVTKLDGTAKGGVVLAIADQFKIPIKYIGVGEQLQHLQIFNRKEFIDSLLQ